MLVLDPRFCSGDPAVHGESATRYPTPQRVPVGGYCSFLPRLVSGLAPAPVLGPEHYPFRWDPRTPSLVLGGARVGDPLAKTR